MPVAIKDVPRWLLLSGISHALTFGGAYSHTLCGTFTNGGDERKRPTKRKCRECIKRLARATLAGSTAIRKRDQP